MEEKKKISVGITDILMAVVSLIFVIGMRTFMAPCGPKEDGTWMSCHWAGEALFAFSIVMLVISVLHLVMGNAKLKIGLSLAVLPVAVMTAVIPQILISLCMMTTMRCHSIMRTAAIIICVVMIVLALADIFLNRKKD